MLFELLRRAADPAHCSPPAIWRCPARRCRPAPSRRFVAAVAVYHGAGGDDIATAMRGATGDAADGAACRVQWTDDLDAAACVMIVLSAGVLAGLAVQRRRRAEALTAGDLPLVFVYSPADPSEGGWDFRGPDFYEARDEAKAAINSHEALVYRHAVERVRARCRDGQRGGVAPRRAARTNAAAAATRAWYDRRCV